MICNNYFSQGIFVEPFRRPHSFLDRTWDKSFDIVLAVNAGYYVNGEFGIARSSWQNKPDKFLPILDRSSYRLSCEYNFRKGDRMVISPKIGYSFGGQFFLHFGLNVLYATDFAKGTFYTRPQIGLSIQRYLELSYGYNIPSSKNIMKGMVNSHVFTLLGHIPVINRKAKPFSYSN